MPLDMLPYQKSLYCAPVPPAFVHIPLRLSITIEAPPSENGAIHCNNPTCRTAGGSRTRGSQQCIEYKCKKCCQNTAIDATAAQEPRDPCKNHGVAQVSDHHLFQGGAAPDPIVAPTPNRRALQAAGAPRRQPLAQPIGPLWRESNRSAEETKGVVENLKARRLEMEAREKRTCELVIYHTAGKPALILSQYIDTFPRLQLSQLSVVVDAFKLTAASVIDYWNGGGGWKIIDISSVLTVETERRTLLKIRPSLLEELSLTDCVGLEDELSRQPRAQGKKRSGAEDIISPLKKTARPAPNLAVGDASRAAHIIVDDDALTPPLAPSHTASNPLPPAGSVASVLPPGVVAPGTRPTKSKPPRENMWIRNLSVGSWTAGWEKIKKLQDSNPHFKTEAAAFPEIFGKPYHKQTIHKYKTHWKETHEDLRNKYIAMGDVSTASWAYMLLEAKNYVPEAGPSQSNIASGSGGAGVSAADFPVPPPLPPSQPVSPPLPPPQSNVLLPASDLPPPSALPPHTQSTGSSIPYSESLAPTTPPRMPPATNTLGLHLPSANYFDPQPPPLLDTPLRLYSVMPDFDMNDPMNMDVFNQIIADHPSPRNAILPHPATAPNTLKSATATSTSSSWPRKIIYEDLKERVKDCFSTHLEMMLEDPTASSFFIEAEERKASKTDLPFTRPTGYFGQRGYSAIAAAVRDLLKTRETDIDHDSYEPLSFSELVEDVLIPEVQVMLILEELNLPHEDAINTLYESSEFGRQFHSDVPSPATPTTVPPPPTSEPAQQRPASMSTFPVMSPLSNIVDLPPLPALKVKIEPDTDIDLPEPDPATLCPFCDEPLPTSPSTELLELAAKLRDISTPDPIPGNQGHRKPTSITQVLGYCEMHTIERKVLPQAIAGGWLFQPNFDDLFDRVIRLGPALISLCEEIEDSSFFRASKAHYTRPPAVEGTQRMSMVQMTSIGHQFASAARLHAQGAGYYGEIGYEIFMVAVRFMFPDNIDLDLYAPLTYDIVLREVLVPEAAARIIQQDLKLSPRVAKQVLIDSHLFGVTRHPSSSESPAVAKAIKYTMQIELRAKSAYRSWMASKSPLTLSDWLDEQKVKWEPVDVEMPRTNTSEVIDLTADSDDEA
ncbi:hypothetical protein B0H12DRAFT_1241061 [Mycena haematopus]|nr:hypothetical protein B0H12DRAFT_1241061 [Mycena haematopus]